QCSMSYSQVQEWMRDHQIKTLSWPAQSPDLNPIENFWNVNFCTRTGECGPGGDSVESYRPISGSVGSYYPAERPFIILVSLHTPTTGEETTGRFWGGPEYGPGSDSAEFCRDQPDYENRHMEVDSTGSYDPYMEYYEPYANCGE
ncbi:hypothetical protein P4O66_017932, partial [Electrophorus voltai]